MNFMNVIYMKIFSETHHLMSVGVEHDDTVGSISKFSVLKKISEHIVFSRPVQSQIA
jgi:hypothetical protein